MSLLRLELGDDLDDLVGQWMECGDEAKKREIAESHYWHRSSLHTSELVWKYITLSETFHDRGDLSYNHIYWEIRNREADKSLLKLVNRLTIILGIVFVIFIIGACISIAPHAPRTRNAPRTPRHVEEQFDPYDDPRYDSGGYRTRGL